MSAFVQLRSLVRLYFSVSYRNIQNAAVHRRRVATVCIPVWTCISNPVVA
jgi:hypothetical protein